MSETGKFGRFNKTEKFTGTRVEMLEEGLRPAMYWLMEVRQGALDRMKVLDLNEVLGDHEGVLRNPGCNTMWAYTEACEYASNRYINDNYCLDEDLYFFCSEFYMGIRRISIMLELLGDPEVVCNELWVKINNELSFVRE
jgi:hypothetical protein